MPNGKVVIFSAPSGAGKTSIVKKLMEKNSKLAFSISATTRKIRPGEQDGRDYYFLTPEEFALKIKEGAFIEYEQVYETLFYGTLKSEIERLWAEDKIVVLDVDVMGGMTLKRYFAEQALAIFVKIPTLEELERRLASRNTETPESLKMRISKASYEMSFENLFDKVVVNQHLETAVAQAGEYISAFEKA